MDSEENLHPEVVNSLRIYRNTINSCDSRLNIDAPGSERHILRNTIANTIKEPELRAIFLEECGKIRD